jgi:hypothetical protein
MIGWHNLVYISWQKKEGININSINLFFTSSVEDCVVQINALRKYTPSEVKMCQVAMKEIVSNIIKVPKEKIRQMTPNEFKLKHPVPENDMITGCAMKVGMETCDVIRFRVNKQE